MSTMELAVTETLPLSGRYALNTDRFVVEPSIHRLLRGRFACTGGHLVISGEESELALDLDASSLRTNILGLRLTGEGGLCAAEFPAIRFRSTAMTIEESSIEVVGRLEVLDAAREIRLSGRLAYADELAVVVWVTGVLPPPRRRLKGGSRISRLLAGRSIRIELAAEFVR